VKIIDAGTVPIIAQHELLLIVTGMMRYDKNVKGNALPVEVGSSILPWHEQRAFRSIIFTRTYKLTLDNRLRWFCRWFPVKFYYNLDKNYANMQVPAKEYDKLKFLMNQGFNLLQQSKPDEAERIMRMNPKGILVSLHEKVVSENNGEEIEQG
jgi:hypothetical protein